MTTIRADWRSLPAGVDLDAIVARVRGQQLVGRNEVSPERYSTDISAAWVLLEEKPGEALLIRHRVLGWWECDYGRGVAGAETAPLAIVRAYLAAKEGE